MNKFLTKIIGASLAIVMMIGGAVGINATKQAKEVDAALSDAIGDKVTSANFASGRLIAIRKNTANEYVSGIDGNWIRTSSTANDWIEFTITGTASSFTISNADSGYIYMSANNRAAFHATSSTSFSTDENGLIYYSATQFLQYNGSGFRAYAANDTYADAFMYYVGNGGDVPPEPTQLDVPTNLSVSGTVFSWTNVENNNGYTYSINTTPNETTGNIAKNATSFDTNSLPLDAGNYTFKLKAKGNDSGYLDSDYCTPVAFTMPEYTVDTFTVSDFAATTTSYTAFSIAAESGSTYVGYSAKPTGTNAGYIQFNSFSNPQNRSIATSVSCGYIRKVSVTWGNANSKEFTVYAGDSAYSNSSAANTGTSQTKKLSETNTLVAISGNHRFVSLYPNGAIYPASVSFYWEPILENQTITASAESAYEDQTITVSSDASTAVTWSIVEGAGTTASNAAVSPSGVISVEGPGTVTVKATARGYNDATKQVTFIEKPAGTYYTITFDSDGGSVTTEDMSILEGQTFVFPSAGTKEHHTFMGWTEDGNSFYAVGETSSAVTADANYLAWWEEDAKFTVTYTAGANGNGSYAHNGNYAGTYTLLPFNSLSGITANSGYRIKNYTVAGVDKNPDDTFELSSAISVTVNFELIPPTDVLTADYINQTGYGNWLDKAGTDSDAVYAGNSTTSGSGAIQIRTTNSNSGIVSTTSGGKIRKVIVTWDTTESGNNGKTLDIYAKNTPYTAATDLYGNGTEQGTKVGSITYTSSSNYQTEVTISGNYRYVGIRSRSNAMYLVQINFEWELLTAKEQVEDVKTLSALAYEYQQVEDTYTYDNVGIRFGGFLSQALWNKLDVIEYGVFLTESDGRTSTIKEDYEDALVSSNDDIDDALLALCGAQNGDTDIRRFYSSAAPVIATDEQKAFNGINTADVYYTWTIRKNVTNALTTYYSAVAYVRTATEIIFLKETSESAKHLATTALARTSQSDPAYESLAYFANN